MTEKLPLGSQLGVINTPKLNPSLGWGFFNFILFSFSKISFLEVCLSLRSLACIATEMMKVWDLNQRLNKTIILYCPNSSQKHLSLRRTVLKLLHLFLLKITFLNRRNCFLRKSLCLKNTAFMGKHLSGFLVPTPKYYDSDNTLHPSKITTSFLNKQNNSLVCFTISPIPFEAKIRNSRNNHESHKFHA